MSRTASLFCALLATALAGCTTVSQHTTVVSQAAAVSGGGATVVGGGASARALAAPTGEFVALETWNVVLVTARSVPRLGEVREIQDAFNFEGRIFAHATFTFPADVHGGRPQVEVRWLNGERVVSIQRAQPLVHKSPYYMASSTSGTALGAGKCAVEFAVNGKVVATRQFSVSERQP